MSNSPAIRVARTQRMLAELGHTDVLEALTHAKEMRSALRVIHTLSKETMWLEKGHIRKLTANALRMDKDALKAGDVPQNTFRAT